MSTLFLKSKTAAYYMTLNNNVLLYTEEFDNAAWVKTNGTITANSDGVADTFTATSANATCYQAVTAELANRTFSIYIKRKTGTGVVSITPDGTNFEDVTSQINGATYTRVDFTASSSGAITAGVKLATSGDEIYIKQAQLEDGALDTYAINVASRYTVTQVTDTDYPSNTVRGCAHLDGRIFVMTPIGEIFQSGSEDPAAWEALDFIQSQKDAHAGVFMAKYRDYVVALKTYSMEFFYNAANPSPGSVLSPVDNLYAQIGCAHEDSVKEMADMIVWMGQSKEGFGRGVFALSGDVPNKISTPQIDKILDNDDLASVKSWSAKVGAHLLYGLTLGTSGVTVVYDFMSKLWSFFTYLTASGGTKTITAIAADGSVTSAAHGYSDGAIIEVASTNADFNGWHVVTNVSTDGYNIQATGTAFSGSGTSQLYTESVFPVIASTACGGRQWMQDATSGALYEFDQDIYADEVGATAARVRTSKFDAGKAGFKTIGQAELIGDKIDSHALLRWTDDDYATYSKFRTIDLDLERSRARRLGNFSRRAFEILHVKDKNFRMEALEIEGN